MIFGMLNLDGAPADTDFADRVRGTLAAGSRETTTWKAGPVLLGCQNGTGSLLADEPGCVLVAEGRIDNAGDVFDSAAGQEVDVARIVFRAWERWGEDSPARLIGDWSFALWDLRERRLFLARDASGLGVVHYFRNPRVAVFGSYLRTVLAHAAVPRSPNPEAFASNLAGVPGVQGETLYEGVRRVPKGSSLAISHSHPDHAPRRWWKPEVIEPDRSRRTGEVLEEFRAIYTEAVRCRLPVGGVTGAAVSSGLDSASVATIAASLLRERGHALSAFTSAPAFQPAAVRPEWIADELPGVQALARAAGNMVVTPIRAETRRLSECMLEALEVFDEPLATSNQHWLLVLGEEAAAQKVETLLTGQAGNGTVSYFGPRSLWPLVRGAHVATLFGCFGLSAANWPRSFARGFVLPARALWRSSAVPAAATSLSLLSPSLLDRMRIDERLLAVPLESEVRERRLRTGDLNALAQAAGWRQWAARFGFRVADPTGDRRLHEFCLRVPESVYWNFGRGRGLLRRGLAGRMPDTVLWERRRGMQSADLAERVAADRPGLQDLLDLVAGEPIAAEWMNLRMLQGLLDETSKPQGTTDSRTRLRSAGALLTGIGLGLFLRRR